MKRYWTWPITLDLFLGGLGGGTLFVAMVLDLFYGGTGPAFALAAFVAVVAMAVACFFLVFELGQPTQFLRVFASATAVIKWGAILLSLAMVFAFVFFLSFFPLYLGWEWLSFLIPLRGICLLLAGICGFCVMIYSGLLLATCKAHAFWASPVLPIHFLISGIGMGAGVCMLCMGAWPPPLTLEILFMEVSLYEVLRIIAVTGVGIGGIIIVLYVLSLRGAGNELAREISKRWINGSYAVLFWGVCVFLGVIVPVLLYMSMGYAASTVASVLTLVTGLVLRFLMVYSDERRLMPGEKRFYSRLPHHDDAFLTAWKGKENMY